MLQRVGAREGTCGRGWEPGREPPAEPMQQRVPPTLSPFTNPSHVLVQLDLQLTSNIVTVCLNGLWRNCTIQRVILEGTLKLKGCVCSLKQATCGRSRCRGQWGLYVVPNRNIPRGDSVCQLPHTPEGTVSVSFPTPRSEGTVSVSFPIPLRGQCLSASPYPEGTVSVSFPIPRGDSVSASPEGTVSVSFPIPRGGSVCQLPHTPEGTVSVSFPIPLRGQYWSASPYP